MKSLLQIRQEYQPPLPKLLHNFSQLIPSENELLSSKNEKIEELFPKTSNQKVVSFKKSSETHKRSDLRIGVVLSGGQASGGHNVITGIFDAMRMVSSNVHLFGFLGGPSGIIDGKYEMLTAEIIDQFRNVGGFHMIGSGRTKIETDEQMDKALKTVEDLKLDGLVVIGGDDSNTNAAVLAEFFLNKGCKTSVIGVPKTIDGDLKNEFVDVSFGFDTATKVYSELIGNLGFDALSAKKYFHFIRLMGRSASHIALECALKTQPNYTLISEEVARDQKTLRQVIRELADLVEKRSRAGKNYGLVLVPEGLVEFIPEMKQLIKELNDLLAESGENSVKAVSEKLTPDSKKCFLYLPESLQQQLLLDRDPHGNVQVSHIKTEELLIIKVQEELKSRSFKGKFSPVGHFFGYEGRSGFPSLFDANYCYSLGMTALLLAFHQKSGYMAVINGLAEPVENWKPMAIPITGLMHFEKRKGVEKPVIEKALVDLNSACFKHFCKNRKEWEEADAYQCFGPIQYDNKYPWSQQVPLTIQSF